MTTTAGVLSDLLDTVIAEETEAFVDRQPNSRAFRDRATHLAGGATSNWQIADPQPVWISHGRGSRVWDVDGSEYSDFHGGYGVSWPGTRTRDRRGGDRAGRAGHPLRPADRGRDRGRRQPRAALRPAAVAVRQLRHRGHDGRRPPDARGHRPRPDPQGRGRLPRPPRLGDGLGAARRWTTTSGRADAPAPVLDNAGIPRRDHRPGHRRAVQRPRRSSSRCSSEHPGEVAGMIVEPVMMNTGIIHPRPGLPRRGSRSCCTATARCWPSTR